jgi:hypothetical protein
MIFYHMNYNIDLNIILVRYLNIIIIFHIICVIIYNLLNQIIIIHI